jgi:hypothetical protein
MYFETSHRKYCLQWLVFTSLLMMVVAVSAMSVAV